VIDDSDDHAEDPEKILVMENGVAAGPKKEMLREEDFVGETEAEV